MNRREMVCGVIGAFLACIGIPPVKKPLIQELPHINWNELAMKYRYSEVREAILAFHATPAVAVGIVDVGSVDAWRESLRIWKLGKPKWIA